MRAPLTFAMVFASTVIVACAATTPPAPTAAVSAGRQCFRASDINGFWGAKDDRVFVRSGVNDVFELTISGMCHDIDWATRIGIQARGGGSWVCHGLDADLLIPGPFERPTRCYVTDIRKLSPEEAKAARNAK